MALFGNLPNFASGQILSANLHLNALQRSVQAMHDKAFGLQMPFQAFPRGNLWPYRGAIRHKYDSVDYTIVISGGGNTATLMINGVEVPGGQHSGTGTYSAVGLDISAMGLTPGKIYEVTLNETDRNVTLWNFAERYSPAYPTLADFSSGTPSAAEWQELSDYAAELETVLSAPVPLCTRTKNENPMFAGTFQCRTPYLSYHFKVSAPLAGGGDRWSVLEIAINDERAIYLRQARTPGSGAGVTAYYHEERSLNQSPEFEGVIDLRDYDNTSGLTVGDEYTIKAIPSAQLAGEWADGDIRMRRLFFAPGSFMLAGWTAFTDWQHGNYIGAVGPPAVTALADNMELLSAAAGYYNYPAHAVREEYLFGVRQWRWLHYKNDSKDDAPQLLYDYRGERRTIGLANAAEKWMVLDLDGIEGLYRGVQYWLNGVTYALEDTLS